MCRNMNELSEIANQIYELEQKKSGYKKKMDELDSQIKVLKDESAQYMQKRQKRQLEAGMYTILYTSYTKPQFNKDAFIANEDNGKELYDKYCKTIQMKKVTVKLATA